MGVVDTAGQAEILSAAMGEVGPETHAKALALKSGVEWESLDKAERVEMASAARRELGIEANAKALALKRGVEWESLNTVGRAEMVSAAKSADTKSAELAAIRHVKPRPSNGLKQLKHVPRKLHILKARIGVLCGL